MLFIRAEEGNLQASYPDNLSGRALMQLVANPVVFLIALGTAFFLAPLASTIASRLGAVDVPGELSIHTRPIPRTGGLAIFVAFLVAIVYAWWDGVLTPEQSTPLWGILVGNTLIALAGLLDDVKHISPLQKFLWQFLAASVVIGLGVQARFLPLVGLGLALTLLYLVGSANAMNLLDGMDGLAGGVAMIAALSFSLIATIQGNRLVAVLALALAGGVLGFLPFNFPRARMFMGDMGSLFLGFNLACLGLLLTDRPYSLLHFAVPLMVLSVPMLDTALALARRFRRRNDLFSGDRDHTYDILARRWGNRWAVVAIWAVSASLGGVAVLTAWMGGWPGMVLVTLAVGTLLWLAKASGMLAPLRATGDGDGLGRALAQLRRRYMHPVLLDLIVVVASFYLALILRFSGERPGDVAAMFRYAGLLTDHIFLVAFIFAVSASIFGLYNRIWRYASGQEVPAILGAGGMGTLVVLIMTLLWGAERPIPISVVLMGGLMTTAGLVGLRYRQRLFGEALRRSGVGADAARQRVLIVGAGEVGQHLAWQMQHYDGRYLPVGYVDDDPEKAGLRVHGVRVLGTIPQIQDLVARHQVGLVVIPVDGVGRERLNEIFDICQESSARIQILPDVMAQLDATNGHMTFRDLTIEDLLGRSPREIDTVACRSLIAGKVIMVTGAAGSIGSELCWQVARYGPEQVLAVDQDETGLHELALELSQENCPLVLLVGDVSDMKRMETIWQRYRPEIVFHCAAYKHVPMLEECPGEAVKTNVQGTLVPATLSQSWGTERFILISTDKAACPANVLGASKRVGELLVMALQQVCRGTTLFSAVRFGNVLGSRGSVMPTFAHQIAQGGPVKVTHPQMKRFFMSIPEAVSLVIQAGAYTTGGDLFVLDMGEEVRIDNLARRMIRLQGLRVGEDIQIEYTGVRPGEKLSEILFCPVREVSEPTCHPSIMQVQNHVPLPWADLFFSVERMIESVWQGLKAPDELKAMLFDIARLLCPVECTCATDSSVGSVETVLMRNVEVISVRSVEMVPPRVMILNAD